MNEERLEELLRSADRAAGSPRALRPDLSARVRREARRQQYVRAASGAAAACVLLAVGLAVWVSHGNGSRRDGSAVAVANDNQAFDAEQIKAQIAVLRAEAEARSQTVRTMKLQAGQQRRLASLRRQLTGSDPGQQVRTEVAVAARAILERADSLCRQSDPPASCAADYRRVVELFPETEAAQAARQRLQDIQDQEGGLS